jgi:hypothetical protein
LPLIDIYFDYFFSDCFVVKKRNWRRSNNTPRLWGRVASEANRVGGMLFEVDPTPIALRAIDPPLSG